MSILLPLVRDVPEATKESLKEEEVKIKMKRKETPIFRYDE